jgi:hypothetical protein
MTFSTPELEPYLVLAQELMRHVYSEESPEEINAWLLAQMDRLSGSKEESAILLWDESFELYERIMAQRAKDALIPESERKTLTWPWASWSALIDPLGPGMLAVMAAADGEGKTLYAECIAEHWASKGCQVVFLHFELNPTLMLDRRTVRHSGIPRRILISGQLTVERALSEVRALRSRELCDVFVVDYLEKASPSEQQEIPALLIAQLNKAGKGQSFDVLDRTAIRGAGEKTEKANVVILLRRETRESQTVQVRIDKNTVGPLGNFTQFMETARFRVLDIQRD